MDPAASAAKAGRRLAPSSRDDVEPANGGGHDPPYYARPLRGFMPPGQLAEQQAGEAKDLQPAFQQGHSPHSSPVIAPQPSPMYPQTSNEDGPHQHHPMAPYYPYPPSAMPPHMGHHLAPVHPAAPFASHVPFAGSPTTIPASEPSAQQPSQTNHAGGQHSQQQQLAHPQAHRPHPYYAHSYPQHAYRHPHHHPTQPGAGLWAGGEHGSSGAWMAVGHQPSNGSNPYAEAAPDVSAFGPGPSTGKHPSKGNDKAGHDRSGSKQRSNVDSRQTSSRQPSSQHKARPASKLQVSAACPTGPLDGADGGTNADKKNRLRWTAELHSKFQLAVAELGGPLKATPKKILKHMGATGLTIFHVKSHLQKYRLTVEDKKAEEDPSDMSKPIPAIAASGPLTTKSLFGDAASSVGQLCTDEHLANAEDILKNRHASAKALAAVEEELRAHMEAQKRLHEQLEAQEIQTMRLLQKV
mmetsp:Transcript_465/g.1617  ORF Transcript_465/g.1617 Transcript_465/m.1617 type:complete len:467 (-) Transcript_465:2548-3948(-)